MSSIVSKILLKLMTSPVVPCIYVILFFGVDVQHLTNFPILRGIKLQLGGGVNSEMLISYFMSILNKKIKGFYVIFDNFTQPLFTKCCYGNIVHDIL